MQSIFSMDGTNIKGCSWSKISPWTPFRWSKLSFGKCSIFNPYIQNTNVNHYMSHRLLWQVCYENKVWFPVCSCVLKWCHEKLPQWLYIQRAEWIVEQSNFHLVEDLLGWYDLNIDLNDNSTDVKVNRSPTGCVQEILNCYTQKVADMIIAIEKETFTRIGYSTNFRLLQTSGWRKCTPNWLLSLTL